MYMKIDEFNSYACNHIFDENYFDDNGDFIFKNKRDFKSTGTITDILYEHWNDYYTKYKNKIDLIRSNANEEVKKTIDCSMHKLGSAFYECPDCHECYFCFHTCKSRFCSSCGIKYQKQIAEKILTHCYNCKHRQIVFTIPKELRHYFFDDFASLNILFDAVRDTLYSIINGKTKKKLSKKRKYHKSINKWMPGFYSFLHTFGRSLIWNPHIHVIIAEMKMGSIDVFKKVDYFDYDALSKRFQKILLDKMLSFFGKSFTKEKNNLYFKYQNGFYVFAEPKKFDSLLNGILYVARYGSRPAIGENRILNYDGENVTYFYNDHKDDSYHEVTVSAFHFITLIIQHLFPKQFKSIRYYGFYNKLHKFHDKMIMMISKEKISIRKQLLKWNLLINSSFLRNPLECPNCGSLMIYQFEIT